jgi:hypothetical protein
MGRKRNIISDTRRKQIIEIVGFDPALLEKVENISNRKLGIPYHLNNNQKNNITKALGNNAVFGYEITQVYGIDSNNVNKLKKRCNPHIKKQPNQRMKEDANLLLKLKYNDIRNPPVHQHSPVQETYIKMPGFRRIGEDDELHPDNIRKEYSNQVILRRSERISELKSPQPFKERKGRNQQRVAEVSFDSPKTKKLKEELSVFLSEGGVLKSPIDYNIDPQASLILVIGNKVM